MSGPMPTHFRWLWYLVGLAGMALTVVGILGILGSAMDLGILIPVVVGGTIAVGAALIWFRRSLDAAVAAAPSRTTGSTPPGAADPEGGARTPTVETPTPESPGPAPGKRGAGSGRTSRH